MSSRKKVVRKAVVKKRVVGEQEIHMKCAKWLRDGHPNLLAFHVANERKTTVQHHLKLKRMGVLNGVADWLLFPYNGRKAAIELKDAEGVQSPEQEAFQRNWERTGGVYFLARTLEEFQGIVSALVLFG